MKKKSKHQGSLYVEIETLLFLLQYIHQNQENSITGHEPQILPVIGCLYIYIRCSGHNVKEAEQASGHG